MAKKKEQKHADIGRKPISGHASLDRLHPDPLNPRFYKEDQNQGEDAALKVLVTQFSIDDLIFSLSQNGYFNEEPMVVVPKNLPRLWKGKRSSWLAAQEGYEEFLEKEAEFTVVEGNRRLAACKVLVAPDAFGYKYRSSTLPIISEAVRDDFQQIPYIAYGQREEVFPYLGVRHIGGVKKWEAFARAAYLKDLEDNYSINQIEDMVGDKKSDIKSLLLAYDLLDAAGEHIDPQTRDKAISSFSLLQLAVNQKPIRDFIGLTDKSPLASAADKKKLKQILEVLYGKKNSANLITDSRQITGKLKHIVQSPEAVQTLIEKRDIELAYEKSDGELEWIVRTLKKVNNSLESVALSLSDHVDNEEVYEQLRILERLMNKMQKLLK